jgi:DNA end-binding protein Ku
MAPRSMWNGTVALGDVVFPVKLYSVAQEHRVRFREVHLSDSGRIMHRKVGSESGEEIPAERINKAYETRDGKQIVVTDDEIALARGSNAKVIDIEHFVAASEIDEIFYEKPYLLGAQDGGERAYRVFLSALERTGKVGIGRFTLRTREQLVALAPYGSALRLYTMRYADELVHSRELDVPSLSREPSSKELEMAKRLIETLEMPWEPERHQDRYQGAVMAVIETKASGGEVKARPDAEPQPTPDLLAALQQSIEASGRRKRAPAETTKRRTTVPSKDAKPAAGSSKPKSKPKPKAGSR